MYIEILKVLLQNSDNKMNDIIEYSNVYNKNIFNNYKLYNINSDKLYLNDKILCINKQTLKLDHKGKLYKIKNNKLSIIKNTNNFSITINITDYYIFYNNNISTNSDRFFYEELLKII